MGNFVRRISQNHQKLACTLGSVVILTLGMFITSTSVHAQEDSKAKQLLEKIMAKAVLDQEVLTEAERAEIIKALDSTILDMQHRGFIVSTILLHGNHHKEYITDIGEHAQQVVEQLLNEDTIDDQLIGYISVLTCVSPVVSELEFSDTTKALVKQKLKSASPAGKKAFLSLVPYANWSHSPPNAQWTVIPNSEIVDYLELLFKEKQFQNDVLNACEAAIVLGNCDLKTLLYSYDSFGQAEALDLRIQKRKLSIIRTWRIRNLYLTQFEEMQPSTSVETQ